MYSLFSCYLVRFRAKLKLQINLEHFGAVSDFQNRNPEQGLPPGQFISRQNREIFFPDKEPEIWRFLETTFISYYPGLYGTGPLPAGVLDGSPPVINLGLKVNFNCFPNSARLGVIVVP